MERKRKDGQRREGSAKERGREEEEGEEGCRGRGLGLVHPLRTPLQ